MKKIILIIAFLTFSISLNSQRNHKIFYEGYVECFHDKKSNKTIKIFNKINGQIISELKTLNNNFCYYKFTISKSKDGWLKIKNLIVLPACEKHKLNKDVKQFCGKWIKAENLKINLPDTSPESGIVYTFYKEPNFKSKPVLKVKEFKSLDLLGVKKTWAFVSVNHNGEKYFGWIERKYQCPYPWTTCPVNE